MKRAFDITLATTGLLVFSPLMALIAVLIKVDDPGPSLYRALRVGRYNRPFRIMKFRTMVVNADRLGPSSTSDDDCRITRVGKFLRKFKLDELPQLLNVLIGDMSIVGPRPEVQKFVDMYTPEEKLILSLRPGISDWASIWNSNEGAVLAGAADADQAYFEHIRPTKLQLQLMYARNHSLWTDCKIIAYTVVKLFRKEWLPSEIATYGKLLPLAESLAA